MKYRTCSSHWTSISRIILFLALVSCLGLGWLKFPWQASATLEDYRATSYKSSAGDTRDNDADLNPFDVAEHVRLVNHMGGAAGPVIIQNRYAYVGFSFVLAVMDISDPVHPVRVGYTALPFIIQQLCVVGNFVFAAGQSNLAIIDASRLNNPIHVGSYGFQDYPYPTGLAANRTHIFLSLPPSIQIIDYTNPASPVQVATYSPPGSPLGLYVRDHYLYSAEGGDGLPVPQIWGGLRILDISDPRAPQEVSFTVTARIALDVVLVDSLAYVADYYSGLWIFDISDPYDPIKLGFNGISPGPNGKIDNLAVVGSTVYALSAGALVILDASDPTDPLVIGRYPPAKEITILSGVQGGGSNLAAVPGIVYLGGNLLKVVDVSNPQQAFLTNTIGGPRWTNHLEIQGDNIYVAEPRIGLYVPENNAGIWILDKSEPTQIRVTSFFSEWCWGNAFQVYEQFAFLACNPGAFHVYDISDPYSIVNVGNASYGGNATDITVDGEYAYIVTDALTQESGLWIFDISNPAAPELTSFSPTQYANSVLVSAPYAYVASEEGLLVFDISQPNNPVLLKTLDGYAGVHLALAGQALYLIGSRCFSSCDQGLFVFSISDPAQPVVTGNFLTTNSPTGLAVSGQHAVISIPGGELFVLSTAAPGDPYQVGWYPLHGYDGEEIVVDGQYTYSGSREGLFTLEYGYRLGGIVSDVLGRPFQGVPIAAGQASSAMSGDDGIYQLFNLDAGTFTLRPELAGYAFHPHTRLIQVPPDLSGANFTILPAPVSVTLFPQAAAHMVFTDTQGLPTTFDIPAGSVAVTSTLTVTPTLAYGGGENAFAGHAFELDLSPTGNMEQEVDFNIPITVTINYSQSDVSTLFDLLQLHLSRWDGNGWQPAQDTCSGDSTVSHDLAAQLYQVEICSTGKYALFGPTNAVFIPYIGRAP